MIQLHRDYLLFENSEGQVIPCSAELVAVELVGSAADSLDPELVQEAASAVLHYFKQDKGCTTVSVAEFSRALEQALQALGLGGRPESAEQPGAKSYDLRKLATDSGRDFELGFFPQLRDEMRARLEQGPSVLRFHGLRGCVKQLVGTKRWSHRCQLLNDQIVEYLRACLAVEPAANSCALIVR